MTVAQSLEGVFQSFQAAFPNKVFACGEQRTFQTLSACAFAGRVEDYSLIYVGILR